MKRRLATILVADVVGYSALMKADEENTALRTMRCRGLVERAVVAGDGHVFKTMGDAVLAEFASPLDAINAAVEARAALSSAERHETAPLALRFGLNIADVMVADEDGDDLLGDGVNLAARIQQNAAPDAIDVSASLFEQIKRTSPYAFEDCGEQRFRNMGEPVRIYRLDGEMRRHPTQIVHTRRATADPAAEDRDRDGNTPSTRGANAHRARAYSVAVLPLEASGDKDDLCYLAEGITEELIFELGRFRKLFVSSRLATRALDGSSDLHAVGERLNVRYVLTGTIRKLGLQSRLSLSLTETETQTLIWNERLTCSLAELIDDFDELVARIASTVLGRVEDSDIRAARRARPGSMTAYEYLLRGLEHHRLGRITDDNLREAMRWFGKAIEADPGFARARAMLTCAWSGLPDFDIVRGKREVERALELDPNEPEAHRIMGSIAMGARDFDTSRYHHEKAMELSPSDAYIKGRSAAFYTFAGEPERALELLDEAEALDPFLPVWCTEERLVAYYALARFEDVVGASRSLPYQSRRSRLYRAASYVALKEIKKARQAFEGVSAAAPELDEAFVRRFETYRDEAVTTLLVERLRDAGMG